MSDQSTELAGPDFSQDVPPFVLSAGVPLRGHTQGEPMIVVRRVLSCRRDVKRLAVAVLGRDRRGPAR